MVFIPLICIFLYSCNTTTTSKLISIEDYTFARSDEDGHMIAIDNPAVFKKGESVHLILLNVGPFQIGSSGLHHFDINIEVTGPDGKTVISKTNLLGEAGHVMLENNLATSPYATCYTSTELASGDYKFKMSVYDRVGSGKVTHTATFTLE